MDYKYIEQLIERYWEGCSTLEEEKILHTFFNQKEVPDELKIYQPIFSDEQAHAMRAELSDDFEQRMLKLVEQDNSKQQRGICIKERLLPLMRAAAIVVIVLSVGNLVNRSMVAQQEEEDINYAGYRDTFSDPEVAYDKVENALELVSEGMNMSMGNDSIEGMIPNNGMDRRK